MPKLTIDDLYPSMPWDEIDAVVFDVGNVLLSYQPDRILEDIVPEYKAIHPLLMTRVFKSPYWLMMDHGLMNLKEAADAMITGVPELEEPIRRLMAQWIEMKEVIQEGLDALLACKAHGKRVYVLSNYGDDSFAHVDAKYDFFRLFDDKIISARVHLMKPDPAIYRLANEKFGLEPSRTLFIDDAPANIEGALYAGWHGLCFNAPGKLKKFLAE